MKDIDIMSMPSGWSCAQVQELQDEIKELEAKLQMAVEFIENKRDNALECIEYATLKCTCSYCEALAAIKG